MFIDTNILLNSIPIIRKDFDSQAGIIKIHFGTLNNLLSFSLNFPSFLHSVCKYHCQNMLL